LNAQTPMTVPFDWTPRHYQLRPLAHFDRGIKRQLLIWPRRAGKDSFAINLAAKALCSRVGTVFHFLPTAKQGRKVIWDGMMKDGRRVIDQAFPERIRSRTVNDEMFIRLRNESVYQVVGSDNYDSIVGTNPIGAVFSEWALSDPRAWDFIRPILTENNGFAIFITTPRGRNFVWDQLQSVKNLPDWFVSHLTVEDTGHISLADIEKERRAGMHESRIQQEFYCSFDATNIGAIYVAYMDAALKAGRIGKVPYDPRYPVVTAWDLGHRDATAIWFMQRIGPTIHAIDYAEDRGKDLKHFVKLIQQKPYAYSQHIVPHDANRFEFGAGNTIMEAFRQHGILATVAPKLDVDDGIEATRATLPRIWFDASQCSAGLRALRSYRYEEDEENNTVAAKPKHDWSSHCCDALRYFAVTPPDQGVIPRWAYGPGQTVPYGPGVQPLMGHNGGPPLDGEEFDPLASWRSAR
jgi:phage terminase large subunit